MNFPPNQPHDFEGWRSLIGEHLERYPEMQVVDVYKLLYQGILGPEHIIPSAEFFSTRLKEELVALQPNPDEPLLEAIRPDRMLHRIHLRPWLALQLDFSQLVDTCLEASRHAWGSIHELSQVWSWFLDEVNEGRFPTIFADEAEGLHSLLQERNFPPAHHSSVYLNRYKPAYRLIRFLPNSWKINM